MEGLLSRWCNYTYQPVVCCSEVSILPKARTPAQTPAQHARTWRTVFIGLAKGTQGHLPMPKHNGALFNLWGSTFIIFGESCSAVWRRKRKGEGEREKLKSNWLSVFVACLVSRRLRKTREHVAILPGRLQNLWQNVMLRYKRNQSKHSVFWEGEKMKSDVVSQCPLCSQKD